MEPLKMVKYLLLLPNTPPVRLVQKPRAEDWIHIDGYAMHTDEKNSSWTSWKHKYDAHVRPGIFHMRVQGWTVAKVKVKKNNVQSLRIVPTMLCPNNRLVWA